MKFVQGGLLALLFIACVPASAQDMPATMTAQEKANVKMVLDWYREVIIARHVELAPKYQAEDYIQHNPNIATGRAAFVKYFSSIGPPVPIPDRLPDPPAVAFGKGDYVVLVWSHSAVDPANPGRTYNYNGFDCLRIQNGKVQEHWDEAQKQAPGPAPAATALSGPPTLKLSAQEQKNLAIATRELKDMLQYNHLEIANETMADSYIQHNPNVPNGREGFLKFFSSLPNRTPEPIKPEWKNPPTLTIVNGPYVFFMWDRKAKDPTDPSKEYTWDHFDMVRVDTGKIQEHWDEAKKNSPAPGR